MSVTVLAFLLVLIAVSATYVGYQWGIYTAQQHFRRKIPEFAQQLQDDIVAPFIKDVSEKAEAVVAEHDAQRQEVLSEITRKLAASLEAVSTTLASDEQKRLIRQLDMVFSLRTAVNARVLEHYGVTLIDVDWEAIILEHALPLLAAKAQAERIATTSQSPTFENPDGEITS